MGKAPATPKLKPSVVSFFDVLGFANLCRTATMSADIRHTEALVAQLEGALRFVQEAHLIADVKWEHLSMFSDNVCIARELAKGTEAETLELTVHTMGLIQWHFIESVGQFIRGGLAVGPHYSSNVMLFGPALVDAVELEKKADWPRIALHKTFVDAWLESSGDLYYASHPSLFARGNDGLPFVDYIECMFDYPFADPPDVLALHKERMLRPGLFGPIGSVFLRFPEPPPGWCRGSLFM